MASHQLAIAKASFSAGLLRPDPTSIPRDDIVHFHTLLENAVIRCSASNIQNCKRWLLQHVLPSPARVTAFGKYLSAFSASIKDSPEARSGATKIPSAKRKRLHILYLLHDVLHHVKYHNAASHGHAAIVSGLQPQVPPLFAAAASFQRCPKHHAKLRRLLDLWEQKKYVGREYAGKLRDVVEHAQSAEQAPIDGTDFVDKDGSAAASNKMPSETDAPYIMPSSHGDPSTPYYDLPAGNMMPHIIPNSSRPIEPQLVKPLQFVQGQADEKLVAVVKDFLQGVDRLYETENHDDEGIVADIDELGQRLIKDEITGQIIAADSYYGWSRAFCEKMKSRGKGKGHSNHEEGTRAYSRGRSNSPRKRRRYSYSDSSRSRTRSRRRSRSRSRSPSQNGWRAPGAYGGPGHREVTARRRVGTRPSGSRSPPLRRPRSPSPNRNASRAGSSSEAFNRARFPHDPYPSPFQPPAPSQAPPIPHPAFLAKFLSQGAHVQPGQFPIPPPPPLSEGLQVPPNLPPGQSPQFSGYPPPRQSSYTMSQGDNITTTSGFSSVDQSRHLNDQRRNPR